MKQRVQQRALDFSSMPCESSNGLEQGSSSSKTSPDFSALSPGETLPQWLEHWLGWDLAFRVMDGKTAVLLPALSDSSSGLAWMRDTSEFRNGAVESSLSEILETGEVDRRFYLSAKACAGILRRAAKRGKELPRALRLALEAVAGVGEPPSEE